MNKISLIWQMFFALCMSISAGCELNFEPKQHSLSLYNRCTTPIEVQHNDGTGRVFTLDSGQIKSFIGGGSNPPSDVNPTYTVDGKSYPFHLEEEYKEIYRYTACYDELEQEGTSVYLYM